MLCSVGHGMWLEKSRGLLKQQWQLKKKTMRNLESWWWKATTLYGDDTNHFLILNSHNFHQINVHFWNELYLTALFNNMRTLKFKGRPTNAFFTAVNQIFGDSSQLTTTAEHCFVVWIVHSDLITARSAVVGSCEEPPDIWLTVAKHAFVGWPFNFRVRMLLKGAVMQSANNRWKKWNTTRSQIKLEFQLTPKTSSSQICYPGQEVLAYLYYHLAADDFLAPLSTSSKWKWKVTCLTGKSRLLWESWMVLFLTLSTQALQLLEKTKKSNSSVGDDLKQFVTLL